MDGVRIAGTGSYLPGPPLDHDTLCAFLRRHPDGLTHEIQERLLQETGIVTRHCAIDVETGLRESNAAMAVAAGRHALAAAGWTPDEVELLVVTTIVPDQLMPPTSSAVQKGLAIPRCTELEISGNCSAPFKGLLIAASQLELGRCDRALLCCSQLASVLGNPPWTNPEQMRPDQGHLRWTLSDGAAALALERGAPGMDLRVWLESAGAAKRPGMTLALGAAQPDLRAAFERGEHHVAQNPRYVLREVVPLVSDALTRMLRDFAIEGRSIDHFVAAVTSTQLARKLQARFAEQCGIRPEVWRSSLARVGYLGGVTLPFAVDELARGGMLQPGDLVCAVAEESSSWTSAATVFRWNP